MGELSGFPSQCNFCKLKEIRKENPNAKIELRPEKYKGKKTGGTEVYVNGEFRCGFMAIGDHCEC